MKPLPTNENHPQTFVANVDAPLVKLVTGYFDRFGWPEHGSHILLALSGGPDSVALLVVLQILGHVREWTLDAAHVNYNLRGADSEADEQFCRKLCEQLGVEIHVHHVEGLLNDSGNLQSRARQIRYQFFQHLRESHRFDSVAIGHTLDDRAESVAAAVLEARGVFALAGIPPLREFFNRPLFDASRADVLGFLESNEIPYRNDRSNDSNTYFRNRIRHKILPDWNRINPAIKPGLARLSEQLWIQNQYLLRESQGIVSGATTNTGTGFLTLNAGKLKGLDPALDPFILRTLVSRVKLQIVPTSATVERFTMLRQHQDSGCVEQGSFVIEKSKDVLRVSSHAARRVDSNRSIAVAPGETVSIGSTTIRTQVVNPEGTTHYDDQRGATLDWNSLSEPLVLRTWQAGDRYHPIGLGGQKSLADLFADRNVPRPDRAEIPILADAAGILWPVGHPIADRAKVTAQTVSTLHVTVVS